MADAYNKISRVELSYRHMEENPALSLQDTWNTALCLCTRGNAGIGDFMALQRGITRLRSFMYLGKYQLEQAQADAAKAAYLSTLIQTDATSFEQYSGSVEGLWLPSNVPVKLGKLRLPSPEAFFYWVKTAELLSTPTSL